MSRSIKGSKGNKELSSRRPTSYIDPSKHAKRATNKAERQRDNTALIERISIEYADILKELANK